MLWRFSGLLKLLYHKYSCTVSEFIRVKYEVKKLGFGLISVWSLPELSVECLLVKAFFQLTEKCCDLPWQHLIRLPRTRSTAVLWFPFLCCKCLTFAHSSPPATTHWTSEGPFQPKWGSDFMAVQAQTSMHSSAAWTELLIMRAFVKHVLLGYVNDFWFLSIDLSLNKISDNLYSSFIKDTCISFSEWIEVFFMKKGEGCLIFPFLYIEIKSNKYFYIYFITILPSKLHVHGKFRDLCHSVSHFFLPRNKHIIIIDIDISIALSWPQENNWCNFNHILVPLFHDMVYNNSRSGGNFS